MAPTLTTSDVKIDSSLLSRIPQLLKQKNYPTWAARLRNTLSAYGLWQFVDGSLTYTGFTTTQTDLAQDQRYWLALDMRCTGVIASTLDDSDLGLVSYDYPTAAKESRAKAIWDKLAGLYATGGIAGRFFLLHEIIEKRVQPKTAAEDLSSITSSFQQLATAGLDLPESFRAMLTLTLLPSNYHALRSTIVHSVTDETKFTMDTITNMVLAEINLRKSTTAPLTSRISETRAGPSRPPPTQSQANRTTVIRRGPPQANWADQNNGQNRGNSSGHPTNSGGSSNQQKKWTNKSKRPGKNQKRDWYSNRQKGKAPARANEVEIDGFVNQVEGEEYMPVDDTETSHIEEMQVEQTYPAQAWPADEDTGMDMAGPSQPFQSGFFSESPF